MGSRQTVPTAMHVVDTQTAVHVSDGRNIVHETSKCFCVKQLCCAANAALHAWLPASIILPGRLPVSAMLCFQYFSCCSYESYSDGEIFATNSEQQIWVQDKLFPLQCMLLTLRLLFMLVMGGILCMNLPSVFGSV